MNLDTVMEELGDAADTIEGLRVFRYPPETLTPPALVVGLPDSIEFETAYQKGAARITIPLVLMEGAVTQRSAVARTAAYAAGSGTKSIKAAIDDYGSYTALHEATVVSADFDVFQMNGVDHIACVFEVDVIGPGT